MPSDDVPASGGERAIPYKQEDNKMADLQKIFPRTGDTQTVYLKNVVTNPNIEIGN